MHILFVNRASIPVFAYGGTERVIWDLGQALVDMGCHEGQGYHIAQPMEREALQAWLLREAVAQAGAAHAVAA